MLKVETATSRINRANATTQTAADHPDNDPRMRNPSRPQPLAS